MSILPSWNENESRWSTTTARCGCEKPMPIQLDFILRSLVGLARAQVELGERRPWKAAYEQDLRSFGRLMAEHYDEAEQALAKADADGWTVVGVERDRGKRLHGLSRQCSKVS